MSNYQRIERIIRYLDDNRLQQPDLESLSSHIGISPFYLHRLFSKWAGITPKSFLKCLNLSHAQSLLRSGENVLNTSHKIGLSGPSRLHDLCVSLEAASPGEVQSGGAGWRLTAGFADTPFGTCLVAQNSRGICHLSFVPSRSRLAGLNAVHEEWPNAKITWNNKSTTQVASTIFEPSRDGGDIPSLRTLVKGTEFQVRVWRALLRIPPGVLVSYSQVAESVRCRTAARAVASAIGKNQVAYLIPCHRVIRDTGAIGQYRWGADRKKAMLVWEGNS